MDNLFSILVIVLIGLLIVLAIVLAWKTFMLRRTRAASPTPLQQESLPSPPAPPQAEAPQPAPALPQPVVAAAEPTRQPPQPPKPGLAFLEIASSANKQPVYYPLIGAVTTIGRDPTCDILLDESLTAVSRRHAQIERANDDYILVDLASSNGVFIDNVAVQRNRLRDGVEINMGRAVSFIFRSNQSGGPP